MGRIHGRDTVWNDVLDRYPDEVDMDTVFMKGFRTLTDWYISYDEHPSLYDDALEAAGYFGAYHRSKDDPLRWFAVQVIDGRPEACVGREDTVVMALEVVGRTATGTTSSMPRWPFSRAIISSSTSPGRMGKTGRTLPDICRLTTSVWRGWSQRLSSSHNLLQVLHPNQFQVNEAWITFKLNDVPLSTELDGDIDIFSIMDAATCFLLGYECVPTVSPELSEMSARRLLNKGQSHNQQWPNVLLVPTDQPAGPLCREAERHGIVVTRVPEDELLTFIEEAQAGFRAYFGMD